MQDYKKVEDYGRYLYTLPPIDFLDRVKKLNKIPLKIYINPSGDAYINFHKKRHYIHDCNYIYVLVNGKVDVYTM